MRLNIVHKFKSEIFFLALILAVSLFVRIKNLNYNSPFNDEAIYIVVGRTGIFLQDWVSYNADSWMAGSQYLFPSLAAIGYSVAGITGARAVNVFFGLGTIYVIYLTVKAVRTGSKVKYLPEFLAVALLGLLPIGVYVSRLATYDAPSFFFLFLSFLFIVKNKYGEKNLKKAARNYFLAVLSLFFAFAFKIVAGIYLPFILLYSYLDAGTPQKRAFYKTYFIFPLVAILGTYIALNFWNLYSYYTTQPVLEHFKRVEVVKRIWNEIYLVVPFYIVGSFGMLVNGKVKELSLLTMGILSLALFQITFKNAPSLDKHTFLMIGFMVIIAAVGIGDLVERVRKKHLRYFMVGNFVGLTVLYGFIAYKTLPKYDNLWRNTFKVQRFLSSTVKNGHRVLAESGASIILAASASNFPTNVSTFDWFEYDDLVEGDAYAKAIKDGYFDFVQLEEKTYPKLQRNSELSNLVQANMDENYKLIYKYDGFLVYRRNF